MEISSRLVSDSVIQSLHELVMDKMSSLPILGVDPTDPDKWRPQIRAEIEKNLRIAQASVSVGSTINLEITLLSDEFIGIDTGGPTDNTDATPMRWLYFFIYGDLERNLYWLPASAVRELKAEHYLGRFEQGYLISSERASSINKRLKRNAAIPQPTGEPNPDLFQSILSEQLIVQLIINPATAAAAAKLKTPSTG